MCECACMVPTDVLASHPGCIGVFMQCSWDSLWIHHNPDQDIAVTEERRKGEREGRADDDD